MLNKGFLKEKHKNKIFACHAGQNISSRLPHNAEMDSSSQMNFNCIKHILVAAGDSYIADSLACFMSRWPDYCKIDILNVKNGLWNTFDFSGYDAVVYTGINENGKKKSRNNHSRMKAAAAQAVKIADKAKQAGIGLFLYLSSLQVYGIANDMITGTTPVSPSSSFGKLNYEIEKALWKRKTNLFRVAILRLPSVYGYQYASHFQNFAKSAARFGIFTKYGRRYSMIHIDNLSSVIRNVIYCGKGGIYFPQNQEYASLYEMSEEIAVFYGKKLRGTKLLNPVLCLLSNINPFMRNIFWGYVCDMDLNVPNSWLPVSNFSESIRIAESGW